MDPAMGTVIPAWLAAGVYEGAPFNVSPPLRNGTYVVTGGANVFAIAVEAVKSN